MKRGFTALNGSKPHARPGCSRPALGAQGQGLGGAGGPRGPVVVELMIALAIAALLCTVIFIAIKAPVKYDDVKLNPADNTRCRAGVVVYKGQTLIFNGQTILCKRENT